MAGVGSRIHPDTGMDIAHTNRRVYHGAAPSHQSARLMTQDEYNKQQTLLTLEEARWSDMRKKTGMSRVPNKKQVSTAEQGLPTGEGTGVWYTAATDEV